MTRTGRIVQLSPRALSLAITILALAGTTGVQAQIIANGPPSFQSNNFPSLETTILDRLALGGQPESADLATLSHLTVLESISLLADVQADMPNTPLGSQLEGQIRQLWDTSATFEESVSANPMNAASLTGVQPNYRSMQAAFQNIESTLGNGGGLSNRAANHLADIARLTAATSAVMNAMESDFLAAVPLSAQPPRVGDRLGQQVRLLANGIVELIQNVKTSKQPGSAWSTVLRDLEELFALVQNLEKTMAAQPTTKELEAAHHLVRRRMWRVEARITRLGWPKDLERQWRGVRERLNAVSDELGFSRVIDRARKAQPDDLESAVPVPKPPARIYRGPPR